jgi:uncharacterized protein with gpF-like domain
MRARRLDRAPFHASKLLRRVPPRQAQPDGIRLWYLHDLRGVLYLARRLVHDLVLPTLPDLIADAARRRGDRLDARDPIARLNRAVDQASRELYRQFTGPKIAAMAREAAEATSDFQREQLFKQIRAELAVDPILKEKGLAHRVEAFTAENVALIKSVPDRLFPEIEQQVIAGVRSGQRYEEIAGKLSDRFAVAEDRAKLIARDQVGRSMPSCSRPGRRTSGSSGTSGAPRTTSACASSMPSAKACSAIGTRARATRATPPTASTPARG